MRGERRGLGNAGEMSPSQFRLRVLVFFHVIEADSYFRNLSHGLNT
jgi:hypothetical protein